jgi:hypothetical protein
MLRRSVVLFAVVASIAAMGVAGCGSSKSASSTSSTPAATASTATTTATATTEHPNAKFILHFGLAAGAFHHFIYLPFRAGDFAHPLSHKLAVVKAGVAGLFVYHELKLAADDVKSSKALSTLFAPITALANKVSALRTSILGGHASSADVTSVQAGGNAIAATANAAGTTVTPASLSQIAAAGGPTP